VTMVDILDFEQYASALLKIRDKEGRVCNFELWPTQRILWKSIQEQRKAGKPVRLCVLKARQQGISSFCVAYSFWKTVTTPNFNCVVIAHDRETSQRLLEIAGFMYDELPERLKPMRRYRSKQEILFENPKESERAKNPGLRSRIEIKTAGHIGSGRGLTIHGLHASELSSYDNPDELVGSLLPAVPNSPETFIIFESTASLSPAGTWFREFWNSCKEGNTPFEGIFIPWFANPEYTLPPKIARPWLQDVPLDDYEKYLIGKYKLTKGQIAWRRLKVAEFGNERRFMVEYPAEPDEVFLGVGEPFLPKEVGMRLLREVTPPVMTFSLTTMSPDPDGELLIWEFPKPGADYVIGVDTSTGYGKSYTGVQVIEIDLPHYRQVACAKLMVDAVEMAKRLFNLGKFYRTGAYGEALMSVESAGVGPAVIAMLRDMGYWRQFRWRYLDHGKGDYVTRKLGWYTGPSSKPIMMQHLYHLLTTGSLKIMDRSTAEELVRLVEDGRGAAEAPPGFQDDLAMALAIACYTGFLEKKGLAASGPEEEAQEVSRSGWTPEDIFPYLFRRSTSVF